MNTKNEIRIISRINFLANLLIQNLWKDLGFTFEVDELFTEKNMNFDALSQMCTRLDEISKMGSEFEDQWVKTSDKKKSNERVYFDAFQTFSEAKKEEKKREVIFIFF